MATAFQIAELASHVGQPPRAAMLEALMDGRALTASELASVAGIMPQTASTHLARLTAAGLIGVMRQGRRRYHRLASPQVARMLEDIMRVASTREPMLRRLVTGPRDAALRAARMCFDHLAGRLGVAIADALVERGAVELDDDGGVVTERGIALLHRAGIALVDDGVRHEARPLCRPCLDWSERRFHIAGKLGAAMCRRFLEQRWVRRLDDTRALEVSAVGAAGLREIFGVEPLGAASPTKLSSPTQGEIRAGAQPPAAP
jgi:DNA-binding transcriptional ArsR family regulator